MSLYIGSDKVCVPNVTEDVEKTIPKEFFDTGGKLNGVTATSMDGWFSFFATANRTSFEAFFQNCSNLIEAPYMDTREATNMKQAFYRCEKLSIVPAYDVRNVTIMTNAFQDCSSLTEIHMYGMKTSFDISASTKFTREALVEILNNLATITSSKTLTMGSTNLAKLTDDDKLIATNKGWKLA